MLLLVALVFGALAGKPDPGQKTVKGCECDSNCGYDLLFGVYDWCYTKNKCGSYSVTRLSYYDYCVYPSNATYESQTAANKLNLVWKLVTANTTGSNWPNAAGLLVESVKTTMEDVSDVLPAERTKYIHSVGAIAQVSFQPAAGSPYTGIFKGSKNAIIRFSPAAPLEQNPPHIVPGFGLKFFRSGVPSANIFAMPSLDGQSSFNFFEGNFTNHPKPATATSIKILAKKFEEASACPVMIGLSHAADYDDAGKKETSSKVPFELVFVPSGKVEFPKAYYDEKKLFSLFQQIPAGTLLFYVFAYETPVARKSVAKMIGTLSSTTQFVRSTHGDVKLFFKHQYMENDYKLHPEWLSQIDFNKDCGTGKVGPEPPNPPPKFTNPDI